VFDERKEGQATGWRDFGGSCAQAREHITMRTSTKVVGLARVTSYKTPAGEASSLLPGTGAVPSRDVHHLPQSGLGTVASAGLSDTERGIASA
jgi:hypothetical protein